MLSAAQDHARQQKTVSSCDDVAPREDDAHLRPNATRAPAGFKLVTTHVSGMLGMDEISNRR